MRKIKGIYSSLIAVMISLLFCGINAVAADNLYFDDPTVKVGEEITIRVFLSTDEEIESSNGILSYDSSYLEFISGDNANQSEQGKIAIATDGLAAQTEYHLTFRALQTGTTKITVDSYQVMKSGGTTLNPELGDSTVTIDVGVNGETQVEPSNTLADGSTTGITAGSVDVGGITYQIVQDFTDADIPDGFVAGDMSFDGATIRAVVQEASGQNLIYLQSPNGEKEFFLYNADNGNVDPFEQIYTTNNFFIIILNEPDKVNLPDSYEQTSITTELHEYPAWYQPDEPEYFVVYALSSLGNKGLYSYDSVEETYQRLNVTPNDQTEEIVEEKVDGTLLGKIENFIKEHLRILVIVAAVLFLVLIILLLVVAIKLRHRNLELDDLYDEYGIDEPDEEEEFEESQSHGKKSKRQKYEEDQIEEYDAMNDTDDYDTDDYDSGIIDLSVTNGLNDFDMEQDDDDMVIDDLDAFLDDVEEEEPVKSKKTNGVFEDTDFIDLD